MKYLTFSLFFSFLISLYPQFINLKTQILFILSNFVYCYLAYSSERIISNDFNQTINELQEKEEKKLLVGYPSKTKYEVEQTYKYNFILTIILTLLIKIFISSQNRFGNILDSIIILTSIIYFTYNNAKNKVIVSIINIISYIVLVLTKQIKIHEVYLLILPLTLLYPVIRKTENNKYGINKILYMISAYYLFKTLAFLKLNLNIVLDPLLSIKLLSEIIANDNDDIEEDKQDGYTSLSIIKGKDKLKTYNFWICIIFLFLIVLDLIFKPLKGKLLVFNKDTYFTPNQSPLNRLHKGYYLLRLLYLGSVLPYIILYFKNNRIK